jgi:drug/metabolite transporter (DMT)-like permease
MILIVSACLILSSSNFSFSNMQNSSLEGFILICLACFSWGLDNNFTRNISHLDPLLLASFKGLIAGSSNLFLGYLIGESLLSVPIQSLVFTAFLGLFGIGFSLVAFIYSLRFIGTARTGAIFGAAPFIGLFLSIAFLGESLSYEMMVAIILMLAGVFLHFSEDHGHEHVHSILSHFHEHIHDEHHQHHDHNYDHNEAHNHQHVHLEMKHKHPHFPDIHHQHKHEKERKK